MGPRPPRNAPPARLLWVEGKDDRAVVQSLLKQHGVPVVFSVLDQVGVDELLTTFFAELRVPGRERFGVVVDANGDPAARWDSIRNTLLKEGYPAPPDHPAAGGVIIDGPRGRPMFGAWIMPDNVAPGALEDFASSLVPAGDPLWKRAGDAIDTIPEAERRFSVAHRSKAHIHTWLAWQEGPGSPMGQAITKGDLDANAPPAQEFVGWLKRLFVDEPAA